MRVSKNKNSSDVIGLQPLHPIDFEYGRLLACMGDKDGARTQLDLVLSGKHLEVNAAGRKVRWKFFFVFL